MLLLPAKSQAKDVQQSYIAQLPALKLLSMHMTCLDKSTCLLFPQATCLMLLLLLTGSKLRSDAPEFRPTEIPRAAARTEPSHRGGDTPREGAASEDASRRTVQQSSAARTPNGSDKEAQDADATPR